jgi:uncharacterized membrane protein YfbV (UPF0208 family)
MKKVFTAIFLILVNVLAIIAVAAMVEDNSTDAGLPELIVMLLPLTCIYFTGRKYISPVLNKFLPWKK